MREWLIRLRGLRTHNLCNLDLDLPRGAWIAITGVSGSGKSSLAFDTLFAEGQRRYLESLAARGHLLPRPDFDLIEGLPPTLAIGQRVPHLSRRQTVGSITEIHDLLAVLYARIGIQHSPTTGEPLHRYTPQEVAEEILMTQTEGSRLHIYAPLLCDDAFPLTVTRLQKMGYARLRIDGRLLLLEEHVPMPKQSAEVVVDRVIIKPGIRQRLLDSITLAMHLGKGTVIVGEKSFFETYRCPSTGEEFPLLRPVDFHLMSLETRAQPHAVRIEGESLPQLLALDIPTLAQRLRTWDLQDNAATIAAEILPRIQTRLALLDEIGLSYLTLNRSGDSLSVGEAQRVQLTAQIGARLAGIAYIMDEPSRGLHELDVQRLRTLLRRLQEQGNTLIIVEHHATLIQNADQVIELGPGAGRLGGQLLYQGANIERSDTPTGRWLRMRNHHEPHTPRKPNGYYETHNITLHNLQNLSVRIPLGVLVGFCGVSGSGKSSLLLDALAPQLHHVTLVTQGAAGLSSTSTPATYVGLMTPLRQFLAATPLARARGYTTAHFSLNRRGGRCEACEGFGQTRIKLSPLPDIWVPCELCGGSRYTDEILQVNWNGYSINDILNLTVHEAAQVFATLPALARRLHMMAELGLDYLQLGQPFPSLSGGEAQRLQLVAELAKPKRETKIYILDEPASGLHAADVTKLLTILHRFVDHGHSVWVIEHRIEILKEADWVIELGPGAGPQGGKIVFSGTPKELRTAHTATAQTFRHNNLL